MYGGVVDLEFDEKKHVYHAAVTPAGVGEPVIHMSVVPGVTSILDVMPKPWMAPWAVKVGAEEATRLFYDAPEDFMFPDIKRIGVDFWNDIVKAFKGAYRKKKEDAADTGKMAHAWCEAWAIAQQRDVTPPPMPTDPEARAACETFLEWMQRHNVTIIEAERKIFSREHWYAGTVDIIGWVDNEAAVLDIKTSSRISYTMHMQTAAYAHAYTEETGKTITKRGIIRLPKGGEPFEYAESNDPEDFPAFLWAKNIYHYDKRRSKE